MCLTTEDPQIKQADKDIICYKQGKCRRHAFISNTHSYFAYPRLIRTMWVSIKAIKDDFSSSPYMYVVEEGYHSYSKPESDAKGVFIIPEGAAYIEGFDNYNPYTPTRVSTRLAYVGRRGHPLTWLRLKLIKLGLITV